MKLLRWGEAGAERPGMLDAGGTARDLTGLVPDIGGAVLSDAGMAMLRGIDAGTLPAVPGTFSTTTGLAHTSLSFWLTMRALMSAPEPAGNGATTRTGFSG